MSKKESISNKASSLLEKSQQKIKALKDKLAEISKKQEQVRVPEPPPLKESPSAKEIKVSISVASVVKATIAIFLLMGLVNILGVIKSVIIIFLVSLFLSATFDPAVDWLEKYKIPRWLGIILIYILVLGVFVVLFSNLVPIIADQIGQLAKGAKDIIQNLINGENMDSWILQWIQPYIDQIWQNVDQNELVSSVSKTLSDVAKGLTGFAGNAIGAIFSIFNGIFNLFLVLVITFFMVLHSQHSSDFFQSLFPHRYSAYITAKSKEISRRLGEWVRGQVLLALAMGVLTFTVFSIIGLEYAMTLAFVSALAEFIPYLGPIITFTSAALIAFNQDPVLVLWLIPAYAVIQFLEGNVLAPLIVGRSVGLNPVVIIFSLLAGANIGYYLGEGIGLAIVGMILAVPVANIISLFIEDYTGKNK